MLVKICIQLTQVMWLSNIWSKRHLELISLTNERCQFKVNVAKEPILFHQRF